MSNLRSKYDNEEWEQLVQESKKELINYYNIKDIVRVVNHWAITPVTEKEVRELLERRS